MSRDNYAGQIRTKGSHIASDIRGIGSVLKEAASDKLHSMKDTATGKLSSIKDSASEKLTAFKDGAVSIGRNTRDAVNDKVTKSPWKSLLVAAGVAAGVGLVAGLFLRRE